MCYPCPTVRFLHKAFLSSPVHTHTHIVQKGGFLVGNHYYTRSRNPTVCLAMFYIQPNIHTQLKVDFSSVYIDLIVLGSALKIPHSFKRIKVLYHK
eukprot:UN12083